MSAFRAAVRTLLESSLRCPKCPAVNRPGATYIEMDDASDRAYCTVCARSGPLSAFQPKEK